jgi:D-amino-acid dehydrogenase
MRIAVLGGGVVGVASAYYLARDGHDVTVYEAGGAVADGTSASTAGLIAPGHSSAWASPQAPLMLLQSLTGKQTSIRVRPRVDPALVAWGVAFLRECTTARNTKNSAAKYALADYSQKQLQKLTADEGLRYHQTDTGVLYLYRTAAALEKASAHAAWMQTVGRRQRVVTGADLGAVDPVFGRDATLFAGAIHDADDGTGNPAVFTRELARAAERLGVQFRTGTRVVDLDVLGSTLTGATTATGERITADRFVLALGTASPKLARTAGIRLPIYPAKGYSVSVRIRDHAAAPKTGGIDEKSLVAWSPFGEQLRMSAVAEFAGHDLGHSPRNFTEIRRAGEELFPGALEWNSVEYRTGLRPMTPDGPPMIGATPVDKLLVNTGHGHLGWTMACGSAALLAAEISGYPCDLDGSGYRLSRYNRAGFRR